MPHAIIIGPANHKENWYTSAKLKLIATAADDSTRQNSAETLFEKLSWT